MAAPSVLVKSRLAGSATSLDRERVDGAGGAGPRPGRARAGRAGDNREHAGDSDEDRCRAGELVPHGVVSISWRTTAVSLFDQRAFTDDFMTASQRGPIARH